MRVADYIIKTLETRGVSNIFGISAGTVSALFDAINDTEIKSVTTRNEAGAAYAAAKYASATNELGVCIGAGAVGINNMTNGIGEAFRAKVPVLIISGYVHRWQIGKGAIQELNTENIVKPITKYSKTILHENEIAIELNKAIDIALTPPYGPVHLSIPIDLQILDLNNCKRPDIEIIEESKEYDFNALERAIKIINEEESGIIMVGRGSKEKSEDIMRLSKHLGWPIITTPQAKGIISTDFEMNLGNYGFSSTDAAQKYVDEENAKCLLVLGSSLGESATRNYNDILVKNRKLIHIDWDKNELNKVFKADEAVYCDLNLAIPEIIEKSQSKNNSFKRSKELNAPYMKNHTGLSLRLFLENIVDILPQNTFFISDIGEYMNFLFKYLPIKNDMNFEININYGAMGSGVAGALGTYLASPQNQIAVFVGDGSFFMNGTEILTAKEYNMPIIYFVINNSMLGYVEHGHDYLYGRSVEGFVHERISIANVAKSLGIDAIEINSIEQLTDIKEFIKDLKGPCLVELITDGTEKVAVADRFKALSNE